MNKSLLFASIFVATLSACGKQQPAPAAFQVEVFGLRSDAEIPQVVDFFGEEGGGESFQPRHGMLDSLDGSLG